MKKILQTLTSAAVILITAIITHILLDIIYAISPTLFIIVSVIVLMYAGYLLLEERS